MFSQTLFYLDQSDVVAQKRVEGFWFPRFDSSTTLWSISCTAASFPLGFSLSGVPQRLHRVLSAATEPYPPLWKCKKVFVTISELFPHLTCSAELINKLQLFRSHHTSFTVQIHFDPYSSPLTFLTTTWFTHLNAGSEELNEVNDRFS